jgi:hypothetical protein
LGCLIYKGKKKRLYFDHLVAQLEEKLSGWSGKLGARIVLIKSTLQSSVIYCLQALSPPYSVMDRINSICGKFLWGAGSSNYQWVNWLSCCKPVEEGGIGVRSIRDICAL